MLFFSNAIWPLLSSILQHLDLIKESYIIRGSGLENTWSRQNADTQGWPSIKVWVQEGLSLTRRQMLGISCEGMRPQSGRKGPPTVFLIQQDVRKSKAVSPFSSPVLAPFHKLMAKAQREVLLMHASGPRHWSVATVQPQNLPVNSQSRLMSKLTHNV